MSTIEILLYAIAAVALLSLFVTIQVACSQDSAPKRKAMQIAIVWLLPIVGALFVSAELMPSLAAQMDQI